MYNIPKIQNLHIELSSKCNASCPVCNRNFNGGPVAPDLILTELTLADIQQMFPVEILENLKFINHCGTRGDPGMASDFLDILKYFQKASTHNLKQHVRTNAGMRDPKFWTEVGEFFKTIPKGNSRNPFDSSGVVFSVDGLEDTNHIYRRGVIWRKVKENMEAYASTGATGFWEWLLFEHNAHQVPEARKMAQELGLEFVIKNPVGFNQDSPGISVFNKKREFEYVIWPADYKGSRDLPVPVLNEDLVTTHIYDGPAHTNTKITCKSLDGPRQEIYVSAEGYLVPCCYIGGIFGRPHATFARQQLFEQMTTLGMEEFDLRKTSMLDILNGPKFSKFFKEGWKDKSVQDGKLLYCVETCGMDSAINHLYDIKE